MATKRVSIPTIIGAGSSPTPTPAPTAGPSPRPRMAFARTAPDGASAGPLPGNQYTSPAGPPVPNPMAPHAGALDPVGGIRDGILSMLTGGAQNSAAKFDADAAARARALAGSGGAAGGSGSGSSAYDAAMAAAMAAYGSGKGDILAHSGRADSDLAAIFARTQSAQQLYQSNAIKGFHANNDRLNTTYNDLLGHIGGAYSTGKKSTLSELARLGLGEARPGAMEGLIRDGGFLTEMARADKANALSNNASISTLISNLMSETRMNTKAAGASYRAQNKIETTKALSALAQKLAEMKASVASGGSSGSGSSRKGPMTAAEKAQAAEDLAQAKAALQLQHMFDAWPEGQLWPDTAPGVKKAPLTVEEKAAQARLLAEAKLRAGVNP